MVNKTRILFGIITKSHTELALDEMYALQDLGYACDDFKYGANKKINSSIGRLYVVLSNAIKLLLKTYRFKPHIIYLNSRLEFVAGTRDFITILIIKVFYYKKVHFILKSHGSDLEVLTTKGFLYSKIISPFLKKHINAWLFLSTEEISWINSQKLIKKENLFLIKNIVRPEKFKIDSNFRKDHKIDDDRTILLYIGRLIEQKGIHYVLDAFEEINKKFKVFLIIVGDGEETENVRNFFQSHEIKKNFLMTGWVDEKEAAYYTSNSEVLIFPTYFSEGFPMVVFNSLAAGLGIITTPTRAAIDYLREPENCLWVEPKSSSSIVSSVTRLLNNEQLLLEMQGNNRKKVNFFTKKVVGQELSEIIVAILSNSYDTDFIQPKMKINSIPNKNEKLEV